MLNIAICDDEKEECEKIRRYADAFSIQRNVEFNIFIFSSGEELLADYQKGRYNLIFLDVEMEGMNGIETAAAIRNIPDNTVSIIYVSSYPQYMQSSFDVRASQYLSKPLSYEIFDTKVNSIINFIQNDSENIVKLETSRGMYFIDIMDIISIESASKFTSNSYVIITTNNDVIQLRGKLKDYAEKYGRQFISPNRSILINIKYIIKFSKTELLLKSGRQISISRQRVQPLKEEFVNKLTESVGIV